MFTKRLACSFCGKGADAVAKLVAGPKVFICDACVATASRIMRESGHTAPEGPIEMLQPKDHLPSGKPN